MLRMAHTSTFLLVIEEFSDGFVLLKIYVVYNPECLAPKWLWLLPIKALSILMNS